MTFLDCLPWEDVLFSEVFPNLPLQSLVTLRCVNRQSLRCVSTYFAQCKELNLNHVGPRFSGNEFDILTKDNVSLRSLSLSARSKGWMTDTLLVPLLQRNCRLECLDLRHCSNVSNVSIECLVDHCRTLRRLCLRGCVWLTANSFMLVATYCTVLEEVDLTGCWDLNDENIVLMAKSCPNLRILYISKIYGLTDKSIVGLAEFSSNLQSLDMQGCWRVTDDAVRLLAEYCKQLKVLNIRECRDVSMVSIARLRQRGIKVDLPMMQYQVNPEYAKYLEKLQLQLQV